MIGLVTGNLKSSSAIPDPLMASARKERFRFGHAKIPPVDLSWLMIPTIRPD